MHPSSRHPGRHANRDPLYPTEIAEGDDEMKAFAQVFISKKLESVNGSRFAWQPG